MGFADPPVIAGVSHWPKGGRALAFTSPSLLVPVTHNHGTRVLFDLTGKIGEMALSKGEGRLRKLDELLTNLSPVLWLFAFTVSLP